MATGPGFPGPTSVYVPNHEASGRLVVGFSRNPDKFDLPKYIQYIQAQAMTGYYLRMGTQEARRVVTQQEYDFPDGGVRPIHNDGLEQHNFYPFLCQRYSYGAPLGNLTVKQATWPIVEQYSQIHATKCMIARAQRVLTLATNSANWTQAAAPDFDITQDHTNNATSLAGGTFDQGTSAAPYLRIGLLKAMIAINQDTMGVVKESDINVIINPNTAQLLGKSSEIHEFIKGSYAAQEEINNTIGPNPKYGLPQRVYGFNFIVDDTPRVTTRKGATTASQYVVPNQTVLIVSRVGGIEGIYGSQSFSTLVMFHFDGEMEIKVHDEPINERVIVSVQENTAEVVACPASGYLITSATSTPT